MKQTALILFLAIILAVFVVSPIRAALDITTQETPPTGPRVLLASPAPAQPGTYLMTHGTGMTVGVGQTFRFDRRVELDRITVMARPLTTQVPGELVTLQILTFDGLADVSPDQAVTAGVGTLPASLRVGETSYVVFDLDDVALEAGRQYGFLVDFSGGGGVNDSRVDVFNTASNSYSQGLAFLREAGQDGAVYIAMAADLVFYLEGTMEDPPDDCDLPAEPALTTAELPGFRFWVSFGEPAVSTWWGTREPVCMPETLCVSGALPGRTEVLLRIVGPKPNGYLWPTLVKLSTTRIEIWIEQVSTGAARCYVLEGAEPGSDELEGLFDRTGFLP
jgi:hypothetical protein